jgi:hypothetical protein
VNRVAVFSSSKDFSIASRFIKPDFRMWLH